jgi:hypothetical protein
MSGFFEHTEMARKTISDCFDDETGRNLVLDSIYVGLLSREMESRNIKVSTGLSSGFNCNSLLSEEDEQRLWEQAEKEWVDWRDELLENARRQDEANVREHCAPPPERDVTAMGYVRALFGRDPS